MAAQLTTLTDFRKLFTFHWNPNRDVVAVLVSWVLVVSALYTATNIIGQQVWGGMGYFLTYALGAATLCGVGLPLYWTAVIRKRPISDLGITLRNLGISLVLQVVFAGLQYMGTLAKVQLPAFENLLPLVCLSLTIGFFEAIFWRGWVLQRLEDAFGLIPAILIGSTLYAAYHIGYGMPLDEMVFLFFIGVLYAVSFRLTKNVFILWPIFQPMGQMVTLVKDGLSLPLIASLGFVEAFALMLALVWLAARYHRKNAAPKNR